jgi:hypothetical protein
MLPLALGRFKQFTNRHEQLIITLRAILFEEASSANRGKTDSFSISQSALNVQMTRRCDFFSVKNRTHPKMQQM